MLPIDSLASKDLLKLRSISCSLGGDTKNGNWTWVIEGFLSLIDLVNDPNLRSVVIVCEASDLEPILR